MPKTPAQAVLDQVIAFGLTPLLRPDGFMKARRNFRRQAERCVQVINVQASAWGTAQELKFTINLGVFFPEIHALKTFLQWRPSAAGPTEYQCQCRSRLGELMPAHRDDWWTLRAGEDPAGMAAEVGDAVRGFGIPWLESRSTWNGARAVADPIDAVAFAVISGDTDQARRHLGALLAQPPHRDDLRAWGRGLGLKI